MCNNTLLGQRLNLSSSSDIFDNLIKKNEWETLIRLFSLNILDINHRDCKGAYAGTIRTASRFTSGHSAGVDSDS